MPKIFLFMEEAGELSGFETLLRKLGFDALSASREAAVAERMLGFHPDLAILPGKGGKVDGVALATKLRRLGFRGSIALTWPWAETAPDEAFASAGVDGVLAYPIDPENALGTIASLVGQDPAAVLAKFGKLQKAPAPAAAESRLGKDTIHVMGGAKKEPPRAVTGSAGATGGSQMVRGGAQAAGGPATAHGGRAASSAAPGATVDGDLAARRARNEKFLSSVAADDVSGVLPRGLMAQSTEELRKASEAESEELADLHESKKDFVKKLFRAAKAARAKAG